MKQEIDKISYILDIFDWYWYLIKSRIHLWRGHNLVRQSHCTDILCTFDLVHCLTCDLNLGWIDKNEKREWLKSN